MSKSITTLAQDINREHAQAETMAQEAITHALEAGRLLNDAKADAPHGQWAAWLAANFHGSARAAQTYMRLSNHRHELEAKTQSSAFLSVDAALKALAAPKPPNDKPRDLRRPDWLPPAGEAVTCSDGHGRTWYAWALDYVAWNGERQDTYACVMVMTEAGFENTLAEYTRRGIRFDRLSIQLNSFGLLHPETADWDVIDADVPIAYHTAMRQMDRDEEAAGRSKPRRPDTNHNAREVLS